MDEEQERNVPESIDYDGLLNKMAKKQMVNVNPEKKDPNKIHVTFDPLKKPKLDGDDLQRHMNDRKKGGPHVNSKDKRKTNPSKNEDGW